MKSGECPKCESRELYLIEQLLVPNYEVSNTLEPLTLTGHYGDIGEGFLGSRKMGRTVVRLEARVCSSCAYTELYVKDLDVLARFAEQGLGGVRKVKD